MTSSRFRRRPCIGGGSNAMSGAKVPWIPGTFADRKDTLAARAGSGVWTLARAPSPRARMGRLPRQPRAIAARRVCCKAFMLWWSTGKSCRILRCVLRSGHIGLWSR